MKSKVLKYLQLGDNMNKEEMIKRIDYCIEEIYKIEIKLDNLIDKLKEDKNEYTK